jgi:hypothetical protein
MQIGASTKLPGAKSNRNGRTDVLGQVSLLDCKCKNNEHTTPEQREKQQTKNVSAFSI